MQKPKIQVSFRINNKLLEAVEKQRLESESPLSQVQYVVALISKEPVFFRKKCQIMKPLDAYRQYQGVSSPYRDKMHELFGENITANSTRFQYRTTVNWLGEYNTSSINLALYIGLLLETGKLE